MFVFGGKKMHFLNYGQLNLATKIFFEKKKAFPDG